ncbi:hypothetical protein GF323_06225 [Candidatus Woesearchaeota archaeon]|nr:hypothetical protein [Candidatus Woesearchaeota archaeon]
MAEEEIREEEKKEEPKFFYCESCGIQLKDNSDRGGGKPDNTWCKDCCNEDGSHKSKEDIKKHIKKDIIMGPVAPTAFGETVEDEKEAEKLAEEYMKKMPAWEVKGEKKEED